MNHPYLRSLLLAAATLAFSACSQAPVLSPQQVLTPLEPIGNNTSYDLALDNAGDGVYEVGQQFSRVGFPVSNDGYLRSYRADGALSWAKSISSNGGKSDSASGVAVDSRGNVYVAGWTEGNFADTVSQGGRDGFIRKYDPAGNVLWTQQLGTSAFDEIWKLTIDKFDNVYAAGLTSGTFPFQSRRAEDRGTHLFVAKYLPSGALSFTRQYPTEYPGYDELITPPGRGGDSFFNVGAITADSQGNLYVTAELGSYDGEVDYSDYNLLKLSASGRRLWNYGMDVVDYAGGPPAGVGVDSRDNVYWVTSCALGDCLLSSSDRSYDLFIRKFSPEGRLLWQRHGLEQTTGNLKATDVSVRSNVLFISGYTYGTVDPGFRNQGGADAFSLRMAFSDSGFLLNYLPEQVGSRAFDAAQAVVGRGLGDHYLSGYTDGVLPGQTDKSGRDALLLHRFQQGWGSAEWIKQY